MVKRNILCLLCAYQQHIVAGIRSRRGVNRLSPQTFRNEDSNEKRTEILALIEDEASVARKKSEARRLRQFQSESKCFHSKNRETLD